jgi:hypothetical protein
MEGTREINLTELMRIRYETKRDNLRENGQVLKREMLKLIELIDAGEWENFTVRRGEISSSGPVSTQVEAIRQEMRRRENLLHYARIQLGGL